MATSVPSTSAAWHWRPGAFLPSMGPAWRRRLRILALAAAALLALFAAFGFFAVPWIAKRQIESLAAAELGRKATVGDIRFNPFTLRGRIHDFTLADREPGATLLTFQLLDLNVSSESIWRGALMVQEARLVRPRLRIALDAAGRSNVQDIAERAMARRAGGGEARFAVHNIEVDDGTVVFEDARRGHRTEVTKLAIGLPFLSGRPGDALIRVKPHLSGVVDGATFALDGTTSSPFGDLQQATVALDFDALPLARYTDYVPLPNGLRLTDGALTTRLTLSFLTWKGKPRGIALAGNAALDRLAIERRDGSALAAVKRVDAHLHRLDLLGRSIAFDSISVSAPEVDVRRLADGSLELPSLLTPPAASAAPAQAAQETTAPWSWSVDQATLSDGRVQVLDRAVQPAYSTRLSNVAITGARIASQGAPGTIDAAFDMEEGAHFSARASVDVAARSSQGRFAVQSLVLAGLRPYYGSALALDVRRGAVDLAGDFEAGGGTPARFALRAGSVALTGLDVALHGEREPLVRMAKAGAGGVALDLATRKVTIDSITANDGALRLMREADGRMNFERALQATAPWRAGAGVKAVAEARWQVVVHRFLAEGIGADFEDRAVQPAVKLRVAQARLAAENLDTAPGATANVDLAARVGAKGRIAVKGAASAQPFAADVAVDARAIDLVALRPYIEGGANVVVTAGVLDARGRLGYRSGATAPNVHYAGNVVVSGFGSLDRPASQELMRWKTLAITGADLDTAPFRVAVGGVTLDHFYARLILDAGAKLNVLQLLAAQPGSAPAESPVRPAAATAGAPSREIPASIAGVELTDGEVEFSDFFVKPNYSVHLTDVNGKVSGLTARREGTVEVAARVDGAAPVDIRGTLNPFAAQLKLDITGKATGADLSPLSPYAVKYAGYGIEKGKLSMEVHYRVDDRKLTASNKLRLDQLTFGPPVDSPTATKLPVLLLVGLLKDRDGVIQLDLPISGTLDDPKFSIWGIVVQIIGNLLTKAATSPFALLGAIVGGGEQLAYIEFQPGLAVVTPASEEKLASLSKALAARPQLRIDAAGRAIPDADTGGLRRAALDRALRLAKQKDLADRGESAPPLEQIALEPADHAKYIKTVYRDTKLPDKPRNFIGIAKDIPPEEMEKLLLAGYAVDDNALRELANRRAQAVKDWLTTKGNIPDERVFVVAPKIGSEGLQGAGAPTRVDFAIK